MGEDQLHDVMALIDDPLYEVECTFAFTLYCLFLLNLGLIEILEG